MSRGLGNLLASAIIVSAALTQAVPVLAHSHSEHETKEAQGDSVLVQMFKWWNEAFKKKDGFNRDAFAKYFTEDAVIKINNRVIVEGVDNFPDHWRPIQDKVDKVNMVVPFEEEFAGEDKIFTHHVILSETDGVKSKTRVMGYAKIRDGRISLIDFLRIEEPVEAAAK